MTEKYKVIPKRKFGRLIVVGIQNVPGRAHLHWKCRCDCGKTVLVRSSSVRNGITVSCGCYARTVAITHGQAIRPRSGKRCATVEYIQWSNIRKNVCKHWQVFENFFADMGKRPDGYRLYRDNKNKQYSRKNCTWIKSRRKVISEAAGIGLNTVKNVAKRYGLKYCTLVARLSNGWPVKEALATPVRPRGRRAISAVLCVLFSVVFGCVAHIDKPIGWPKTTAPVWHGDVVIPPITNSVDCS